ncbi:hypothetical protein [Microvirga sp.]|uniref:hypothetical protein n=1 Tax=Microvirga sp. TaxID=1873136 RepID=UPI001685BADD|nr:hypothetical protein [Microvirga sp.]
MRSRSRPTESELTPTGSGASGSINIELMWADTKADQAGLSCLLTYDSPTNEPEELRIAAQRSLSLLIFTFNYVSYVPWKNPGLE